jgi:hypothetical protein
MFFARTLPSSTPIWSAGVVVVVISQWWHGSDNGSWGDGMRICEVGRHDNYESESVDVRVADKARPGTEEVKHSFSQ